MKKPILFILFFCSFISSYAQETVCDKLVKVVKQNAIDSTQSVNNETISYLNNKIVDITTKLYKEKVILEHKYKIEIDSIKVSKYEKINYLKNKIDNLYSHISNLEDTITYLNDVMNITNEIIKHAVNKNIQNGNNQIKDKLVETYKTTSFDDLINFTSPALLQRDKNIIGNNEEVEKTIIDLETYFKAKKLLTVKFNKDEVDNYKSKLSEINQESDLVENLVEYLDNYEMLNDGLKETISNINEIDNDEIVKGMDKRVKQAKLNKILAELSLYTFDYDLNFEDYPYLSDIFLEIMKSKQSNPDADISDFLK